jgi:formylglycine-generating enzyme required for sulfatase activity
MGSFLYGATEEDFKRFMATRSLDFPGMEERMRRLFVIPPESLSLPTYYMDTFEVTNREFRDFVRATDYRPQKDRNYLRHWSSPTDHPDWAAEFPVTWVSQTDAMAYCKWRGKRLPTEEEWEKAARGGDGRHFPWGNSLPTREVANYKSKRAEPIGNRPEDQSPYGVYDLAGNVAELTSSREGAPSKAKPVVRGGCYKADSRAMLSYYRQLIRSPDHRAAHIGFRCLADKPTPDLQAGP